MDQSDRDDVDEDAAAEGDVSAADAESDDDDDSDEAQADDDSDEAQTADDSDAGPDEAEGEDDADTGDANETEDEEPNDEAPIIAVAPAATEAQTTTSHAAQPLRHDVALRQDATRGRRKRRGRRGAGGRDGKDGSSGKNGQRRDGGWRKDGRGDRGPRRRDARISRSVPITEVVKEGDEVIVQVSKEPIGTKGARVTSHVSLPGRHVVYLPTVEHVGVSKRIGSAKERARLRQAIDSIKPPKGGLIVRTVAEGLTKKQLKSDIGYLVKVWEEVSKRREGARPPTVLYTELDLVLKVARDLFTDEIERIVIDDRDQYGRLVRFVEMFMPERAGDIELYQGDEPIFDAYGIEDEIARALSRKVPLPSGGYLIIDQAEALTAIDVNTGRFVGKGSRDLEETALKTNLEAVDEIAYQLRFRNIGGLVILDLIDMERPGNREQVWRALEAKLAKDKAKTTLNRISELGLIEMTRKRTRESLGRVMHEPCFYCDGTGQIQSRATIAYEILRQIRRDRAQLAGYSVVVNAHPAVIDFMQNEEREAVE
jgi:ribonuclease G